MRVSYVISDEETRNFDSTLYSYQRVVHEPHPLGGPVGEAVPIDSLVITRNGNQLKAIEDHAVKQLTYTGASDFYDGSPIATNTTTMPMERWRVTSIAT